MMSRFLDKTAELTPLGRRIIKVLVVLYAIAICLRCFSPQTTIDSIETPNIIYYGRLRFLLVPFNTFVGFSQLDGFLEIFWVIAQNVMNIFLLFPLMLGVVALCPKLRTWQRATLLAFIISLCIETTQIVVDLLYNANRVFEIDDLWTNTFGGLLAFLAYQWFVKRYQKYQREN